MTIGLLQLLLPLLVRFLFPLKSSAHKVLGDQVPSISCSIGLGWMRYRFSSSSFAASNNKTNPASFYHKFSTPIRSDDVRGHSRAPVMATTGNKNLEVFFFFFSFLFEILFFAISSYATRFLFVRVWTRFKRAHIHIIYILRIYIYGEKSYRLLLHIII